MAVSVQNSLWDRVAELTKVAQQKGVDPLLWAIQLSSNLNSAGVALPSVELANLLVSQICWDNNEPVSWKFLEKALMLSIVPPILVLALLTTRFILVCFCSLPLSFFLFFCACVCILMYEFLKEFLFFDGKLVFCGCSFVSWAKILIDRMNLFHRICCNCEEIVKILLFHDACRGMEHGFSWSSVRKCLLLLVWIALTWSHVFFLFFFFFLPIELMKLNWIGIRWSWIC